MAVGEIFSFFVNEYQKTKIVIVCLIYLKIASYFDVSNTILWKMQVKTIM